MFLSALKHFSAKQRESGDIARAFARCFATPDGRIVLEHLHQHSLFRVTDPNLCEAELRFLEGQRQTVLFICQTIAKAHPSHPVNGEPSWNNPPKS